MLIKIQYPSFISFNLFSSSSGKFLNFHFVHLQTYTDWCDTWTVSHHYVCCCADSVLIVLFSYIFCISKFYLCELFCGSSTDDPVSLQYPLFRKFFLQMRKVSQQKACFNESAIKIKILFTNDSFLIKLPWIPDGPFKTSEVQGSEMRVKWRVRLAN